MKSTNAQVILASSSIGRKMLLEKLGVSFRVVPSTINEDIILHSNPIKMLQMRAKAKAEDVAKMLTANSFQLKAKIQPYAIAPKPYLIIAADSMAVFDGQTFGKAKNKADARRILKNLMGKTHNFVTATSIIYLPHPVIPATRLHLPDAKASDGQPAGIHQKLKQWNNETSTRVTLRLLSPSSLAQYVTRYDFTRFADGYALNETPWDLVTKIEGSYTNVIGLPFEVILPIFRKFRLL